MTLDNVNSILTYMNQLQDYVDEEDQTKTGNITKGSLSQNEGGEIL